MKLKGKRIGCVITGCFSIFNKTLEQLELMINEKAELIPIMSNNAYTLDTRFGKAKDFVSQIKKITRKRNYSYNSRC